MNVELTILQILDDAHPRQLKKTVLESEVRLTLDDVTASSFDAAFSQLDRKRQVRVYGGEDVTRVSITDTGRERVAAAK